MGPTVEVGGDLVLVHGLEELQDTMEKPFSSAVHVHNACMAELLTKAYHRLRMLVKERTMAQPLKFPG